MVFYGEPSIGISPPKSAAILTSDLLTSKSNQWVHLYARTHRSCKFGRNFHRPFRRYRADELLPYMITDVLSLSRTA